MTAVGYENAHLLPTKYLRFEPDESARAKKTAVFKVLSQSSDMQLGRLAWYGPWRQYVFFPEAETVFNSDCLVSINAHLETLNRWHRNILAHRKEQ